MAVVEMVPHGCLNDGGVDVSPMLRSLCLQLLLKEELVRHQRSPAGTMEEVAVSVMEEA